MFISYDLIAHDMLQNPKLKKIFLWQYNVWKLLRVKRDKGKACVFIKEVRWSPT